VTPDLSLDQYTAPVLNAATMARMRPVAQVARDLGIRTEVEVPRLPGIADLARVLAEAIGVTATIVMFADGILIRFTP
jgi:hypothetical protein